MGLGIGLRGRFLVQPALLFEPGPFPGLPGPVVGPKGPQIGKETGAGFIILSSLRSAQLRAGPEKAANATCHLLKSCWSAVADKMTSSSPTRWGPRQTCSKCAANWRHHPAALRAKMRLAKTLPPGSVPKSAPNLRNLERSDSRDPSPGPPGGGEANNNIRNSLKHS